MKGLEISHPFCIHCGAPHAAVFCRYCMKRVRAIGNMLIGNAETWKKHQFAELREHGDWLHNIGRELLEIYTEVCDEP